MSYLVCLCIFIITSLYYYFSNSSAVLLAKIRTIFLATALEILQRNDFLHFGIKMTSSWKWPFITSHFFNIHENTKTMKRVTYNSECGFRRQPHRFISASGSFGK